MRSWYGGIRRLIRRSTGQDSGTCSRIGLQVLCDRTVVPISLPSTLIHAMTVSGNLQRDTSPGGAVPWAHRDSSRMDHGCGPHTAKSTIPDLDSSTALLAGGTDRSLLVGAIHMMASLFGAAENTIGEGCGTSSCTSTRSVYRRSRIQRRSGMDGRAATIYDTCAGGRRFSIM